MKTTSEHQVRLSERARESRIGQSPGLQDESVVFGLPGVGRWDLSTLSDLLQKRNIAAVFHGFRSRFDGWASELTNASQEVQAAGLADALIVLISTNAVV